MIKEYIARTIVMFLKKHKLNVHDWSPKGRDDMMKFYNFYYTEYRDLLDKVPNLETTKVDTDLKITLDYSFKGIELDINDLPWFLTRNRYLLNKNCKSKWSYYNQTYTFENEKDLEVAKRVFGKDYKIS